MSGIDEQLSILCWEGYHLEDILAPFRISAGVRTRARTLISDAHTASGIATGDIAGWDILNINNAYVRDYLYPRGFIEPLPVSGFSPYDDMLLPNLDRHFDWRFGRDGALLGICQRFGTFNLVINTRRVSQVMAEDQGFELANDPANHSRFGILEYDDFNIFHICIGAGLNPFTALNASQLARFENTARRWYGSAAVTTTDHHRLNKGLVEGEIDFYISGGVYTVSPARLTGHDELWAITPKRGPIGGKGAIAFVEITSMLRQQPSCSPRNQSLSESFIEYLLQPHTAAQAAFIDGTCNPVAQMGDARVLSAFTNKQLHAIQWDTLCEDMARCATYAMVPEHDALLRVLRNVRGH